MRSARGFTLIELMVTIAIAAILLAVVVPSLSDLLARRRLEGMANELSADLQYARTESVSRRLPVRLSTLVGGGGYTVIADPAGTPVTLKTVTLTDGVSVTASTTMTYTPLRGLPNETAAADVSIDVASARTAGTLRVISNFMGRVQLCSPSSTLVGYKPC